MAKLLATTEGVAEMTPEHWVVVRMIREHYLEHGNAPMVRLLCQRTGINLGLLIVPESGCYAALGRLFRNPIEGGAGLRCEPIRFRTRGRGGSEGD